MWAILRTDNTFEFHDGTPSLKKMQKVVGGFVEAHQIEKDVTLWYNEEGKSKNLPLNRPATALMWATTGPSVFLLGDVVMTGGADGEGETLGLTEHQAKGYYFVFTGNANGFERKGECTYDGSVHY